MGCFRRAKQHGLRLRGKVSSVGTAMVLEASQDLKEVHAGGFHPCSCYCWNQLMHQYYYY